MHKRWLSAIALLILAIGITTVAPVATAQTTGTIEGTVADQNGAGLPGVSVEIKSTALLGTRAGVTDGNGRFRFPAVPPGAYTVSTSLSGFTKVEKAATVGLGATASVSIVMSVSMKEEVVVTGEAPAVDFTTTTGGTNYTAQVMNKLPLGRNYADVVRLQPGVQTDNGETQGRSLALSVYGSTSAENLFLIDGVNTTNVIKGFQGKTVNSEFVQELEVKTGGYQAEYGRNTGGVINVITKQGGNDFHGGVFGYYDNASTRSSLKVEETPNYSQSGDVAASNTFPKNTRYDLGASLGGYFLKDYVWFFAAYNKVKTDRTTQPTAGPVAGNEFPEKFDSDYFSGKLTFRVTSSTDLSLAIIGDPQVNTGSILNDTPTNMDELTWGGTQKTGGQDVSARLTQIFGSVGLATVQYGHHKDRWRRFVPNVMRTIDYTDYYLHGAPTTTQYGGLGRVFGPTVNNESNRDSFKGTMSLFLGKNEIKFGADYQKDVTLGTTYYTGGQRLQIFPCQEKANYRCDLTKAPVVSSAAGTVPVFYGHNFFSASGTDLTPLAQTPFETPNKMWSWFIQDEFKVLPNLVVNAGIRYDDQKVYKGDNSLAFDLKSQWSPRVGFSWDFLNDGSSKLYGSWGRFHYATPTDLNVRVFTANTQVTNFNYSATGTDQDPGSADGYLRKGLLQVGSVEGEPIDAGLKASYQDEFSLGVEKALDPTFSVGAKFTYRKLGRTIEDRCDLDANDPVNNYNSCAIFNPGGSGPAASGQIATCNGTGNPFDPTAGDCTGHNAVPAAERKYQGFELVARKRLGDSFWAQASYVYSKLEGNYSGAIRTENGQTDPGINADFDYYQFLNNSYGKLELDRPHSFRLDGAYTFPFGLQTSLGFFLRSGTPYGVSGYFNDNYVSELYLVPRGSAGRTPIQWDADLSLGYNLHVGAVTITPQIFVFNLFNNQIATDYNTNFNPNASFIDDGHLGIPGVAPGQPINPNDPNSPICTGGRPCSDNADYMKITGRTDPRILRFAVKVNF